MVAATDQLITISKSNTKPATQNRTLSIHEISTAENSSLSVQSSVQRTSIISQSPTLSRKSSRKFKKTIKRSKEESVKSISKDSVKNVLATQNRANSIPLSSTLEISAKDSSSSKFANNLSDGKVRMTSVKRHSSHRSTGSDDSGKRPRTKESAGKRRTPDRSSKSNRNSFRDSDCSFRRSGTPSTFDLTNNNHRTSRISIPDMQTPPRNDASPTPSQDQSFPQSAIDTAFGAGAALLRLVLPRSKRSSTNSRDYAQCNNSMCIKDMPPWMQEGPPVRPAPTPPIDQMSLKSVDSSLAEHTYEMVLFGSHLDNLKATDAISETELPCTRETLNTNYKEPDIEAPSISHPSSRKTSIRRKRKKSKSRGTLTDEYFSGNVFAISEGTQTPTRNVFTSSGVESMNDNVYSIPCPSPVLSPCPTPPLRHTSLYQESSLFSKYVLIPTSLQSDGQYPVGGTETETSIRNDDISFSCTTPICRNTQCLSQQNSIDYIPSAHTSTTSPVPIAIENWTTTLEANAIGGAGNSLLEPYSKLNTNLNASVNRGWSFPGYFRDTSIPIATGIAETRQPKYSMLTKLRTNLRFGGSSLDESDKCDERLHCKTISDYHLNESRHSPQIMQQMKPQQKFFRSNSVSNPVEDFKKFRACVPSSDQINHKVFGAATHKVTCFIAL